MWLLWIGFIILIVGLLALDLGVFHRKAHVVNVREALFWSGVWVGLALLFDAFVYLGDFDGRARDRALAGTRRGDMAKRYRVGSRPPPVNESLTTTGPRG